MPWVILDRDGVINHDSDAFIRSPQEWVPIPGSIEAMARLTRAGWRVAIATNQSGLARGLFNAETLAAIHDKLERTVAARGGRIDALAYCPHGPDDGCTCRKPAPGLYRELADRLGEPLQGVPVIGDSARDLEAAAAVGARPVLVRTGKGEGTLARAGLPPGTEVHADLAAAVAALLEEGEGA
ncbi:D-glycero-beta-D-manno-heptose 1,7-bisphosphate 7-phosphatase [Halorhodospira halophila]|uniref:D,D-heptose 1,7-bisphosphate phosphatase n=1 Tax=Halorhodospira halophila (strain DSM 244 / SL1) TaxID=349124 RepID=A1WWD5_HALHL|nr:D-glycero-beta-D-manno-heptose 1,7-bisphosphate 7-phosphatase [Halorhodospira halophila]ABM61997.1 D-alpha,beta-D-heptose 1,7-bisphosphate phosphatase [Halorhodospira halophila SL1]MBK1729393.1 D-glycero-beta-D-manno-heptose-1,7-bisphosphate 7-phosphatase [Halorhodospira halophila]